MDIFVDADGCPVIDDIVEIASEHTINIIHNRHHQINLDQSNVRKHETGDRPDEVDHYIYNNLESGDIVITDDLGLAALVLGRNARAIRFRGEIVNQDDIEYRLSLRHYTAKARRKQDYSNAGPPSFSAEDRSRFRHKLKELLHGLEKSD